MNINNWLNSIADAGKELLRRRIKISAGTDLDSISRMCEALYSNKGEALGTALAEEVTAQYGKMNAEEKSQFLQMLASEYGPDSEAIRNCARDYIERGDNDSFRLLSEAVEAPRQKLMRRINMAPSGTRTIVNMRKDLLERMASNKELQAVDDDFKHLLTSWFNPGFLTLKRIDWSTPAAILEKLIEYEAVHEMTGWDDLRRRLDDCDRRCFGFFHPALPDEPLIFVEVALMDSVADSVQSILAPKTTHEKPAEYNTAIFYSISNCQEGLRGISFGNFLIKQVVMHLKEELPQLKQFATLSPIPGFSRWLEKTLSSEENDLLSAEDRQELAVLKDDKWFESIEHDTPLATLLMRLCAHYLYNEKRRALPLDPVARFHLGNGASIARLNWLGDISKKGIKQSAGLLVNYQYDLEKVEENHERLFNSGEVTASKSVLTLLKQK